MAAHLIRFRVTGHCRREDGPHPVGAAACVRLLPNGESEWRTVALPPHPTPTRHRAKLMALRLALVWALEEHEKLPGRPLLDVAVYSDSKFAIITAKRWLRYWYLNDLPWNTGWRDIVEELYRLHNTLLMVGTVRYHSITCARNWLAVTHCNKALDWEDQQAGGMAANPADGNRAAPGAHGEHAAAYSVRASAAAHPPSAEP